MKLGSIVACGLVLLAGPAAAQDWRPLFNGRDLAGWTRVNGTAPYSVEGGAIVGRTVLDSPNSFLVTTEEFDNFILEFEAKLDDPLNSGVQIRSHSDPAYKQGRVHGYQVEIDPTERAWTGGIYDESRRGWLHTLQDQPEARRAFRMREWNRFRVEAIGSSIRTWVNGVPCADIIDDLTPRGFLGLQVHAIGKDAASVGRTVRWRNLRIATSGL